MIYIYMIIYILYICDYIYIYMIIYICYIYIYAYIPYSRSKFRPSQATRPVFLSRKFGLQPLAGLKFDWFQNDFGCMDLVPEKLGECPVEPPKIERLINIFTMKTSKWS